MQALILILLLLPFRATAPTELEGYLSYAGRPLTDRVDLAVLVHLESRGGAFVDRRVFHAVSVERGRFAISVDLRLQRQRPLYLEFRLRRSGLNDAFEVLRPRQIVLPRGTGWALQTEPGGAPWRLHITEPAWG